MLKKMTICALLILVLVPACAMAAGTQGQVAGIAGGSGLNNQPQTGKGPADQEEIRTCLQQGNGTGRMIQNRTCNGDGVMLRTMTKGMVQQGPAAGACKNQDSCDNCGGGNDFTSLGADQTSQSPGRFQGQVSGMPGSGTGTGSGYQMRDRTRDYARNRWQMQDGSCGNCPST